MFSNISRRKIIFLIAVFILIIFLVVYFYFFYQNKVNVTPGKQRIELTEEEIVSNFEDINNYYKENPTSIEEKEKDLKKINEENSTNKPLTDEERAAIINSLKQ